METPFPAYRGDEPYVFVCYAHEDADTVYPELRRLHEGGVNLWYDEGISPGHEWTQNLADAIEGSGTFLYFLSPSSVASRHCRNEVQYSLDQEKAVVAVYLEPTELTGGLKLSLGPMQAIKKYDLTTEDYHRKITDALQATSSPLRRTPVPAAETRSWRRVFVTTLFLAAIPLIAVGVWWAQRDTGVLSKPLPAQTDADSTLAIAVLPFANMSSDPEQAYFSDGITEDILNELARNTSLTVRPRSSAFALKGSKLGVQEIGERLNVTHVLEGSIRRSGERIRVTVQLSDAEGNRTLWSRQYERELSDIFLVQDDITREVLDALSAQLVRHMEPRRFVSNEAYEAFLRGRYHLNRFEIQDAISWLKISTDLDPNNADAWAQLARINALMTFAGMIPNSGEPRRERNDYIDRALAINPLQANALGLRALYRFVDRDYQSSIEQLVELVETNPNNPEGYLYLAIALRALGKDVLSLGAISRFVVLDPAPNSESSHVTSLLHTGSVQEARKILDEYKKSWTPADEDSLAFTLFDVAFAEGDVAKMQAALDSVSLRSNPLPYGMRTALVLYLQGDQPSAKDILRPLISSTEYVSHWNLSRIALIEGRFDDALNHWREGIQAGEPSAVFDMRDSYPWRKTFPEFYASPGYQQMLSDFGLDALSISKISVPDLPF